MFLDEARIAARIHHPHVVEIIDLGEGDDDVFYMVMEYVEGATLSAVLRHLRSRDELLSVPVALQAVADACQGLAAAHELCDRDGEPYGLVHRDVSPQNLLVSLDGWVKVVDFGIMKAAGKRSNTLTGQLRGKLPYMSPEQAKSMPVDHRADLFALGVVLWELLTNERLFAGANEVAVLENISRCELPDISTRRPNVPPAIDAILRRTIAHDPNQRYESARAMLADVRQAMRALAADVDPRRELADLMRENFSAQVEYMRAIVRSSTETSGELDVSAGRLGPAARTDAGTGPLSTDSSASLRPTAAVPEVQTVTSTIASAPARHWSLWIVLPLIGAAIGTAVAAWNAPGQSAESSSELAPMPAPAASTATAAADAEITWNFNTFPQGATVTVDGQIARKPTPVEVRWPAGDDTVFVRIEKDGYDAIEVELRPDASSSPFFQLTASREPEDNAGPRGPARISARPGVKSTEQPRPKRTLKPHGGGEPLRGKETSPRRELKKMPDFDKQVGDDTGSAGGGGG
jgi:serine/threonine-protein kinase